MKFRLVILLLLLVYSCGKFADSEKELIDSMSSHAHELYDAKNYNAAIDTMNKVALIAARRDNPEELATCYRHLGMVYWAIKDTGIAMNYYQRALEFAKVVSKDLQAETLTDMGNGFYFISNYTKALYYYSQVDMLGLSNDNINYNYNIINLGNTYMQIGQYTKARLKAKQALKFFKKINDTYNIGSCYAIMVICDGYEQKPFEMDYSQIKDEYVSLSLCEIYLNRNDFRICDSITNMLINIEGDNNFLENIYYFQALSAHKQRHYIQSLYYTNKAINFLDGLDYTKQKQILDLKIQNYTSLHDMHNLNIAQKELHEVEEKIAELEERNQHELLSMQRIARAQHNILEYELNILKNDTALFRIYVFIAVVWIVATMVVLYIVFVKRKRAK